MSILLKIWSAEEVIQPLILKVNLLMAKAQEDSILAADQLFWGFLKKRWMAIWLDLIWPIFSEDMWIWLVLTEMEAHTLIPDLGNFFCKVTPIQESRHQLTSKLSTTSPMICCKL